jgi:hypothetical protein
MKTEIDKDEGYELMGAAFEIYEQEYGLGDPPQPGGLQRVDSREERLATMSTD